MRRPSAGESSRGKGNSGQRGVRKEDAAHCAGQMGHGEGLDFLEGEFQEQIVIFKILFSPLCRGTPGSSRRLVKGQL